MIKPHLLDLCIRRSPEWLASELWNLPFEPYAPVRKQLLGVLRLINAVRHAAGQGRLSPQVLRYQRNIIKPFEGGMNSSSREATGETMKSVRRPVVVRSMAVSRTAANVPVKQGVVCQIKCAQA